MTASTPLARTTLLAAGLSGIVFLAGCSAAGSAAGDDAAATDSDAEDDSEAGDDDVEDDEEGAGAEGRPTA